MSHRHIPSGFVKNVLQNGVGRYVCQLQRLTFQFCKSNAGSRGTRDFIETHLLEFTRANPGIAVYIEPRRHHRPRLVGEYLNGNQFQLPLHNLPHDEVCQWVEHMRAQSGCDVVRFRKQWHTDTPSIQGIWTPFYNRDTSDNVASFPNKELSAYQPPEPTASERLLQLAEELREQEKLS